MAPKRQSKPAPQQRGKRIPSCQLRTLQDLPPCLRNWFPSSKQIRSFSRHGKLRMRTSRCLQLPPRHATLSSSYRIWMACSFLRSLRTTPHWPLAFMNCRPKRFMALRKPCKHMRPKSQMQEIRSLRMTLPPRPLHNHQRQHRIQAPLRRLMTLLHSPHSRQPCPRQANRTVLPARLPKTQQKVHFSTTRTPPPSSRFWARFIRRWIACCRIPSARAPAIASWVKSTVSLTLLYAPIASSENSSGKRSRAVRATPRINEPSSRWSRVARARHCPRWQNA